jgi:hypothetical protein
MVREMHRIAARSITAKQQLDRAFEAIKSAVQLRGIAPEFEHLR